MQQGRPKCSPERHQLPAAQESGTASLGAFAIWLKERETPVSTEISLS